MVGGLPFLIATGHDGSGVGAFEIGGGDDDLTGTAGADLLIGGRGNDSYLVNHAGDAVREGAGGGS